MATRTKESVQQRDKSGGPGSRENARTRRRTVSSSKVGRATSTTSGRQGNWTVGRMSDKDEMVGDHRLELWTR